MIGSCQTWLLPNLVVCSFFFAEALFYALCDLWGSFALFCALLGVFCVRPRLGRPRLGTAEVILVGIASPKRNIWTSPPCGHLATSSSEPPPLLYFQLKPLLPVSHSPSPSPAPNSKTEVSETPTKPWCCNSTFQGKLTGNSD